MGKAEALMTPTPESIKREARIKAKYPQGITADMMRESIRRDAKRFLTPYFKKVQSQRGLPKGPHKPVMA
jgi:hypothetical protein